jgi:Outer membrane lipoprotein carrier protein LolA-like
MMRRALALLVLAGCSALSGIAIASAAPGVAPAAATDPASPRAPLGDLDAVMSLLAMRQHGRVEFVEQQFLAILDHPVESSGELRYDAPDRLEKRTLLPHPEDLVLAGGVLTMERGGRSRVLDLHRYPQIQPFVESIRATLAGDRGALEKIFHVDFAGDMGRWSLILVPLDSQLMRAVKQVQIDGSRDQLLRVEIRQADGDRSLMTLRAPAAP